MPLRTKLFIFAVLILLLFTGLSVGTYLSLFRASFLADTARDRLAKLSHVETLEANCANLKAAPDHVTSERFRRTLASLEALEWRAEGRLRLARVRELAKPLFTGDPVPKPESLTDSLASLKAWILERVRDDLHPAEDPIFDRAVRLLAASCLLAVGGTATFAWLASGLARERRKLENRVRRSEKLAALGTLAAGVAHEVNNPLATVCLSAEALAEQLPPDSDGVRYCQAIQVEAHRCRTIIDSLSDLARGGSVDREPVDVRELAHEALRIVRRNTALPPTRLLVDVPQDLPLLSADRGKLLQVLVNLLINGIEAAGAGGEVRLSALREESRISVAVSDNGKGIPKPQLDHIFEPFYTDKVSGVGLGLTLCHRIAEIHGGELRAASPGSGRGSTFTLVLPIEVQDVT